jgi:hypothetical protein
MSDEITPTPIKPGYKTTEFWLSAAVAVIGLLMSSGVIQTGSNLDKIIGIAASALAALGYSISRGNTKAGA